LNSACTFEKRTPPPSFVALFAATIIVRRSLRRHHRSSLSSLFVVVIAVIVIAVVVKPFQLKFQARFFARSDGRLIRGCGCSRPERFTRGGGVPEGTVSHSPAE